MLSATSRAATLCLSLAVSLLGARGEPARPSVPANLPANQWVELPLSGLKGQAVTNAGGLAQGLCYASECKAVLACDNAGAVKRLNLAEGRWEDLLPPESVTPRPEAQVPGWNYNWGSLWTAQAADGRAVPVKNAHFHGIQACFDPDRRVVVGFTRGETVQYDLAGGKCQVVKTDASPPDITAGSLCHDPRNKQVVLATGGFSPAGGTDGTWLYEGAKKQWRRLEGPKAVEEVRLPLEKARERLLTLRWLVWKNLEFRATGREGRLDERSKAEPLAKEAGELAAELKRLADAAKGGSAKALTPYHQERLAEAGRQLDEAIGKLSTCEPKLKSGSPEELESLYRGSIVPALDGVDKAASHLAVSPEPRMSARLVYDARNKLVLCFGGDRQDGQWGDTWAYHCEGRWWERRRPKSHPAPQEARALAFDQANGLVVLLEASRWGRRKAERLWTYDAGQDDWRCLDVLRPQGAFWLECDATAGCLVALTQDLTKAWLLRLEPGAARQAAAEPAPEVELKPVDGDSPLRDAAAVAEIRKWHAEMAEWVRAVPANSWVRVPTRGPGRPNAGRTWSGIVYDPDRLEVYYRDGGHGSYHGAVTDHYDVPTGRWFRSGRKEEPPWPMGSYFGWGRSFRLAPWCIHTYKYALFYNPLTRRLNRTAAGTQGALPASELARVARAQAPYLEYDPDTGAWSRDLYLMADLKDNQWVVPGAPDRLIKLSPWTRYNPKPTTSVWQRTAQGEKTWPTTGFLPYQHDWDAGNCFFYDPRRTRALYYGGAKGKPELFALDLAADAPAWQKLTLTADGATPPAPMREIVYLPKADAFLMLDGRSDPKQPPVVWSLGAADHAFRRVPLALGGDVAAGDPGLAFGGVSCGLQYDPVADLCFYIRASGGTPAMYAFRYLP